MYVGVSGLLKFWHRAKKRGFIPRGTRLRWELI